MLTFILLFRLFLRRLPAQLPVLCAFAPRPPQGNCVDISYVHNIGLVVPVTAMIHLLSHVQKGWIWLTVASV